MVRWRRGPRANWETPEPRAVDAATPEDIGDEEMDPVMKALSFGSDAEVETLPLPERGGEPFDEAAPPQESLLKPKPRQGLLRDDMGALFDALSAGASVSTMGASEPADAGETPPAAIQPAATQPAAGDYGESDLDRELLNRSHRGNQDVAAFGWDESVPSMGSQPGLLEEPITSEEIDIDDLEDFDEDVAAALFARLNAEDKGLVPVELPPEAITPLDVIEPPLPEVEQTIQTIEDASITVSGPASRRGEVAVFEPVGPVELGEPEESVEIALVPQSDEELLDEDAREFGQIVDDLIGFTVPDELPSDNATFEEIDLFGDLEPLAASAPELADEDDYDAVSVDEAIAVADATAADAQQAAGFIPAIELEDDDAELRMALAMLDDEEYGEGNDEDSYELEIDEDDSDSVGDPLEGDMDISELLAEAAETPVEIHADELLLVAEGDGPKPRPVKSGKIMNSDLTLHSYDEHLAALEGPALNPVHLYLRSGLPVLEQPEHHEIMAAILMARCDYQYFKPLVADGLAGRFRGYYGQFRKCLENLESHVPPRGSDALNGEWDEAWNLIESSLPPSERRRRVA